MDELLFKEEEYTGKVVKGLKHGDEVSIESETDTKIRGIIKFIGEKILVLTLLDDCTSSNAHAYHWQVGDLKSVLFNRIKKIKKEIYG